MPGFGDIAPPSQGRLSAAEALRLGVDAPLLELGARADARRRELHPGGVVTYIVDRNVNPTNVCITDCDFCSFYARPEDEARAYVQSTDEVLARVGACVEAGGVQILMQGGHHPRLRLDWYEELLRAIKDAYPGVWLHALSPPEIHHIAKLEKRPVGHVLDRLIEAGLGSVPGGGAEILVDRVRRVISRKKLSSDEWLDVMRQAHLRGLSGSATMMFGHVETAEERVEHLEKLRALQDETGGFTAFACWTLQPTHEMADLPRRTHAFYLRWNAISRLMLDNIPSIQASFVTQGIGVAQISLSMGVNDMGGGMMEENVVSAAGTSELVDLAELERHVLAAGFLPRRRDTHYKVIDERPLEPSDAERAVMERRPADAERVPGPKAVAELLKSQHPLEAAAGA